VNHWFLTLCVVTWMIYDCCLFCDVVHESLVCSEQLNWALFFRKILQVPKIHQFSSIFCIFEPFTTVTEWFWDPSFHMEDNWGTNKKGSNIHWCSRRKHEALRVGGWKLLNRMKMFSYFAWIYFFFSFSTALRKQQKILACFPEDKLNTIYLDLQIPNVFWSISECLNLF